MDTPEVWFHRRATLFVEAQILFHLNQVGVLGVLGEGGAHSAQDLSDRLQLNPQVAETLLDYVFEVDNLLERDEAAQYRLSEFGRQVVDRYSREPSGVSRRSINMFDVRVGAYGPVWRDLDKLLRAGGRYGVETQRDGRFAEDGVFKLAAKFWEVLTEHVDEFRVDSAVEVGLTSGLLDRLAARHPERAMYGLDRNGHAIERAAASASAQGLRNVHFLRADYYAPDTWCSQLDGSRPGLIFSLHFHELLSRGEAAFIDVLRALRGRLGGWVLLAFEQPRLAPEDRSRMSESQWLYAQSNVLIHHLIGNGRILSRARWLELGERAGCRSIAERDCKYLNYRAFAFHL